MEEVAPSPATEALHPTGVPYLQPVGRHRCVFCRHRSFDHCGAREDWPEVRPNWAACKRWEPWGVSTDRGGR